jgi:hypothetical protein
MGAGQENSGLVLLKTILRPEYYERIAETFGQIHDQNESFNLFLFEASLREGLRSTDLPKDQIAICTSLLTTAALMASGYDAELRRMSSADNA